MTLPFEVPLPIKLMHVRRELRDGDLLLFRGHGLTSRLIRTAGRSEYSHAAMVAWCHGLCMCLEMRELRGGRAVTLASQVERFPGCIDAYTVRGVFWNKFDRHAAVQAMIRRCGGQYSYAGLWSAALLHLPFVRLLAKPNLDDVDQGADAMPEFCSQAVANAARLGGGIDPVPNTSDRITEPGDLARSHLWEKRWRLLP